jgi:tetratricopeptide (TPR) repeat protein
MTAHLTFRRGLPMAAAFAAALALFAALMQHGALPATPPAPDLGAPAGSTATQIARLSAAVRAAPRNTSLLTQLAAADLQRVRETGDAGYYLRADGLLRRARALAPHDADVLAESASLAASRHDFRGALALARASFAAAPQRVVAYPILVDALVELGRYGAADRALQRFVDVKPILAAYARVSYVRELHGDLRGAADAMQLAVDAGGAAPENVAYVQSQLGALELQRGRLAAAAHAFREAQVAQPLSAPAAAGMARVAAARGDLALAIRRWRTLVARLPLPEYVIGLGEAELAAGRDGARDLALVGAEEKLLNAAGVNTDAELAVFEADHGSPARAVALARRAWAAAPSVRSADALGWALTRAGHPRAGLMWARRALRLGSVDPLFLEHAGLAALAAARARPPAAAVTARGEGRAWLRAALAHGLAAYPWQAARVREALR